MEVGGGQQGTRGYDVETLPRTGLERDFLVHGAVDSLAFTGSCLKLRWVFSVRMRRAWVFVFHMAVKPSFTPTDKRGSFWAHVKYNLCYSHLVLQ